jgi:sarcosine oxidase/L-pipecolate oxidase
MMPIIGDLVRQRMENTLDPALTQLWAIRNPLQGVQDRERVAHKVAERTDVEDVVFAKIGQLS